MEHQENLLDVLKTIFRRKKIILYTCGIVAIGSLIFALLKDDYYQAVTLFYAANHDLAKPNLIGSNNSSKNYYGTGEDIDRILSICNSNLVADHLIEKFDLYNHYDIDTSSLRAKSKIKLKFFDLFTITKTKFDGIELAVEDKDPKLAAAIANAGRLRVNEVAQNLVKQSQAKEIIAYENSIKSKEQKLAILSDSLTCLRVKYGIYNTINQSIELPDLMLSTSLEYAKTSARLDLLKKYPQIDPDTIILLEADLSGIAQEVKMTEERLRLFQEGVSPYERTYRLHQQIKDQIGIDINMLEQLRAAYTNDFTAIHLVEAATVPIIKSRPKRSILILGSIFIAFLFSVIGVLLLESYKDVNWRSIING